jgi:sugar/nucleoside kinase (ribokinase family)
MLDESIFKGSRLCVVGNVNRDLKTPPLVAGDYFFRDGETSIDGLEETIGGGGANSAAIAAMLGAQSSFIGQIGDDEPGRRLEEALQRANVRCHLHRARHLATGTTLNLVFTSGHRHFLSCHPNNNALSFEVLDLAPLSHVDHLLRADIWFSKAMLESGNERLFRAARAAGVATSLDLNWDPKWGHAPLAEIERRKEAVRRVLPLVDLAHGNVRELSEFTGEQTLDASLGRLLEWGVGAVCVHLGAQGAGYFSQGECIVEPAVPVARHVVATGTGDVLSACLMLLHHRADCAMPEKLRLANRIVAEFIEAKRSLIPRL